MKRRYTLRKDLPNEEQERRRVQDRKYYHVLKTKPGYKETKKKFYLENREHLLRMARVYKLRGKYDMSYEEYQQMLANQNFGCAICGGINADKKDLSVDHDHKTGKVRGLLCGNCNRALGLFKDDPNILEIAKEYVL